MSDEKPDYADSLEGQMIVDYVADGMTLIDACRVLGFSRQHIYNQISASTRFAAMMEQARTDGYEVIANDCLAIADEVGRDTNNGKPNKEWMARSRLRVDTRLKLLSKWHPKKYGEKLQVEQKTAAVQIPVTDDPIEASRAYERLMRGE